MGSLSGFDFTGGILGGVTGFLSGNQGKKSQSKNTSGVNLNDPSQLENDSRQQMVDSFSNLQNELTKFGPTGGDYRTGVQSSRDLADLISQYQQSGGLPNSSDIKQASDITSQLFAGRTQALNNSFIDQNTAAQRLSAQLGRPVNDPTLQNQLRTGFIRQQNQLGAEQQAASSQMALALPQNRLSYATQRTNLLNQLGGQSLSNQNFLLGLGSQLQGAERAWNYQTSDKFSNTANKVGGGWIDGLSGAIGGAGAGAGLGIFGGGGGGGGGGGSGGGGGGGSYSFTQAAPSSPSLGNYGSQFSGMGMSGPTSFGFLDGGSGSSGGSGGGGSSLLSLAPLAMALL